MIKKRTRAQTLRLYPEFPTSDYQKDLYHYPKRFGNYVLTLASGSEKKYPSKLSESLNGLFDLLDLEEITFMADSNSLWLLQNSSSETFINSTSYFESLFNSNVFRGSITVSNVDQKEFIFHLIIITRFCASLPVIYFIDAKANILGNICRYGNVHLDVINKNFVNLFEAGLIESDFSLIENKQCEERFSGSDNIIGRELLV